MIFSRKAQEECRFKRFTAYGNKSTEQHIARLLISHTQQVAASTGLPVYTIFSAMQQGQTFGARFTQAIQTIFDKGFRQVIAIGNDCLSLNRDTLLQARQALVGNDLVVGPAHDGGIYLLGIAADAFHRQQLAKMRWQTGDLFGDIVVYAGDHASKWDILQMLTDVDNPQDLRIALHKLSVGSTLYRQIMHLLFVQPSQVSINDKYVHTSVHVQPFRGPPVAHTIS